MLRFLKTFFILLFFATTTITIGQKRETPFELYTHLNGLSNSHVNCIIQDSKGFMWFGTDYGLNKFDGFKFITYTNNPKDKYSLPSDEVSALYLDHNGYMWVGTYNGLAKFDHKTEKFQNFFMNNDTVQYYKPIRAITGDQFGKVWVGTSGGGVLALNANTGESLELVNDTLLRILGNEFVYAMQIDKHHNLWVGTEGNGIKVYSPLQKTVKHFTSGNSFLKSNWILALFEDMEGKIWIGTRGGGLSIFDPARQDFSMSLQLEEIKDEVFSFTYSRDSSIWIGTKDGGLIVYNSVTNKFSLQKAYAADDRFKSKRIRCIYTDKDGNSWIGIHQLGISMLKNYNYPFRNTNLLLPHEVNLSNYSILGILLDSRNNLWLGTDGNGLISFNLHTKKINHYLYQAGNASSLPNNVVRTIYEDKNKNIWIGTYKGGLSKFLPSSNQFKNYLHKPENPNSLSFNDVVALAEDLKGRLWIATNGGGLCLLNEDEESFTRYSTNDYVNKTTICSDWLTCLHRAENGILWVGSFWGLSQFDPENLNFRNYFNEPSNPNSMSSNIVFAVHEDKLGNLWIGTKSGLNKLEQKTGKFSHFGIKEGLPNEVINSILADNQNNFWLATNNGLSRFNGLSGEIKNFYYQDGLVSNEFIHNARYQSPEGQFFLGSVFGFNAFYPDSIRVKDYFPKVIITDFKIFNKSVPIGKNADGRTILEKSIAETEELRLAYFDNSFSFDFVALDYILPERINYACKMEGFEENWNYLDYKRRFITYTNLDPGTYTFLLKASSRNDEWGEETTRLIIHIRPPIWRTSWAYSIFAILFMAIALFLWKLISDRIADKHLLRIERIRQAQVEQLNQEKLEFFTNISHEFRTPLTLIIGPVENLLEQNRLGLQTKKALQMILRNAYRLLRLVNQLLDLRKVEKGKLTLQATESDIVRFIREVYQNFEELAGSKNIGFELIHEFEELIVFFDQDKLDKILFNLFSNAFKFTKPSGYIKIMIEKIEDIAPNYPEGFVRISVEDNGKGISPEHLNQVFDRFYQVPDSVGSIQKGTGIGLSLTKSLVELHHGRIWAVSNINNGSIFTIELPLGKSHLKKEEIGETVNLDAINLNHQPPVLEEYEYSLNHENIDNQSEESLPLILIVEDNEDVKSYIKSGLKRKYRIAEAENGKEGIEKTLELMPDLIISDVMMPVMDGITFTKKIKTDLVSCHIPVILLTAKTSIEHRIEGLETGADSYIPKPFNPRHLQIRIEKLIELRQILKEKFKTDNTFEPVNMAITSADEKFMKKVIELIKQKISDPELSVENLGEGVGMSRAHLHRKMKALLGQSPSDFIRNIRLKQAAFLLENEDIPVSEVCYLVGFNSPSYFTSCFSKLYKLTPSQYRDKKQNV